MSERADHSFAVAAPAVSAAPAAPTQAPTGSPARAIPAAYVTAWAILSAGAAAYMAARLPATMTAQPAPVAAADKAGEAELATMKHNLAAFQRELGELRATIAAGGYDASTAASLAALEERMSMTSGLAVTKVAQAPVRPQILAQAPTPQAVTPQAPATPAIGQDAAGQKSPFADARQFTISPADPAAQAAHAGQSGTQIETGSIATATGKLAGQLPKSPPVKKPTPETTTIGNGVTATATNAAATAGAAAHAVAQPAAPKPQAEPQALSFGPAVVKPEPKPFAVQLASGGSIDDIRSSWQRLSGENADALSKLTPRFTSTATDAAGPTFDLVAGPVKTAADARRICKSLAARGIDCKVATFSGDAL